MKRKLLRLFFLLCFAIALLPLQSHALNKNIFFPRTRLKDVYVNGYPYQYGPTSNWTLGKNYTMFTDKDGNVGLFSYKKGNKPRAYIFDQDYKLLSNTVINLPSYDTFANFAVAADGNYYVVVGHNNKEEKASKTVVSLLKISSKTGEVIKKGELRGKHFGSAFSSIREPFSLGTAELVENNGNIYIHMSYTMFKAKDGKNHQASNLFIFDSATLEPKRVESDFYVSHSFNQMIKSDGSSIVTISLGDGYPRALRLATLDKKGNFRKTDLFSFKGAFGKNETGTTVTGLEIGKNTYLVVGESVTHNNPVNKEYSKTGEWFNGRNVYLTVTNKKNLSTKHMWITTFDPSNKDITISDPRIFKSGNSFVVMYSVTQGDTTYTELVTVDENGKILARSKKDKILFATNNYPLLKENKIIWISPWAAGMDYYYLHNKRIYSYSFDDSKNVYLFEVDISSPTTPKWIEGIRPQSIVIEQKSITMDYGDAIKLTAKVYPENTPFNDITWISGNTGRYSVTKDGYVTAVAAGLTDKVIAQGEVDQSVTSTITITTNAEPKRVVEQRKKATATPKDKQKGLYSSVEYYPLEKGKQTKSIVLKSSTGSVPKYYLTSSDESIVRIKDSTIPIGVNYGTATVYFNTADTEKLASCVVEVTFPLADGGYLITTPKTNYKVGEPFETEGFSGVRCINGKEIIYYTDKNALFFVDEIRTDRTAIWGRGRPLTKAGTFEVRVYLGDKLVQYKINVSNSGADTDKNKANKVLADGQYNLRCMYNYLNITSSGEAELRTTTPLPSYELKSQGDGNYTITTPSGKYLGIADPIKDGIQLKEVGSPYLWTLYSENNNDIFSLRPASNLKMVVNAAGQKKTDGTWIILWTHENTNAPGNAEFRFIPVK